MGQVARIPLTEGAYEARSVIASAQRCVNLYLEKNPEDSPFPYTLYPTPGLNIKWTPPVAGPARCTYNSSAGKLYHVVGSAVYYINSAYIGVKLGDLTTVASPVSMIDNGTTIVIVDGSMNGFLIDMGTNVMTPYADPNYLGSDRVDYLDGFFMYNQPDSRNFYTSLYETTAIDALYIARKVGSPDLLSGVACIERQAWLLGRKTSEVWGNAGTPSFPFQAIPGAFVRHGIASVYSVALHSKAIYAVMQDAEGDGVIVRLSGYAPTRISTPAIEQALSKYPTLSDAVGFTYQQSGHAFYVVSFPTANKTWVFDIAQERWHERSWCDGNGEEQRWRGVTGAFAYGDNLTGDWQNGKLYSMELERYNDFGGPIVRRRGFPHAVTNGRTAVYEQFQAEMEVGNAYTGNEPEVMLRYSLTRGKSWSTPQAQSLYATGDYLAVPQWRQFGVSRDMVFELYWSADTKTALNGAYCTVTPTDG
jgi:hypothetical protein